MTVEAVTDESSSSYKVSTVIQPALQALRTQIHVTLDSSLEAMRATTSPGWGGNTGLIDIEVTALEDALRNFNVEADKVLADKFSLVYAAVERGASYGSGSDPATTITTPGESVSRGTLGWKPEGIDDEDLDIGSNEEILCFMSLVAAVTAMVRDLVHLTHACKQVALS